MSSMPLRTKALPSNSSRYPFHPFKFQKHLLTYHSHHQIGNEINDGFLWPVGKISTNGFSAASQLLHSAASGVRAATGGSNVKIMVHLANGWDSSGVNWFFNGIFNPGQFATSDFDLFGFSFYPFYNSAATYSALQSTLTGIVNKYNKVRGSVIFFCWFIDRASCRILWLLRPTGLLPVHATALL